MADEWLTNRQEFGRKYLSHDQGTIPASAGGKEETHKKSLDTAGIPAHKWI
jgi:hypothetical protein